jgi:hypothetical protein
MMGFFSRTPSKTNVPPRPPIDEAAQFIEWMLRYHEAMEYLRKMLAPKAFEALVPAITKVMMRFLETYNSAEKLMDRLIIAGELNQKLQPILAKRDGDISQCPQEIQTSFIDITSKLSLLPYFLKYKYGVDFFFDNAGLKEL